jgi:hypothetical protein
VADTPLGHHEDSLIKKAIVMRGIVKEFLTKAIISGCGININQLKITRQFDTSGTERIPKATFLFI